jgi:hypothetical protein
MPRRRKSPPEISPGLLLRSVTGREWRPVDEISLLLADAQPTYAEIEGEPDPRKRRKRERARDFASDRLAKMYLDAEKRRELDRLDFRVRIFCKLRMDRNDGRLPKPKGGRPTKEPDRFLISIEVLETIERLGVENRGSVEAALEEVRKKHCTTYRNVRNIYYDSDPDWRRAVLLELARRDPEPDRRYAALQHWAWHRKKQKAIRDSFWAEILCRVYAMQFASCRAMRRHEESTNDPE